MDIRRCAKCRTTLKTMSKFCEFCTPLAENTINLNIEIENLRQSVERELSKITKIIQYYDEICKKEKGEYAEGTSEVKVDGSEESNTKPESGEIQGDKLKINEMEGDELKTSDGEKNSDRQSAEFQGDTKLKMEEIETNNESLIVEKREPFQGSFQIEADLSGYDEAMANKEICSIMERAREKDGVEDDDEIDREFEEIESTSRFHEDFFRHDEAITEEDIVNAELEENFFADERANAIEKHKLEQSNTDEKEQSEPADCKRKNPHIRIVDIKHHLTMDELKACIFKQNPYLHCINAFIEVKKIMEGITNYMAIVECDPKSFKYFMDKGNISICWYPCKVYEHVFLYRCFNCGGLKHKLNNCPYGQLCLKCSRPGHTMKNCTIDEPMCINCVTEKKNLKVGLNFNHSCMDSYCPILIKKVNGEKSKINYE